MGISASILLLSLILFLPSRGIRIRAGNLFGKIMGPYFTWLGDCKINVNRKEHLDRKRPAIYVSNHTSVMDIFIAIWLSPFGTVGVAKKEVLVYPFFGQAYLLSGHLWIDRKQTQKTIASLKKLAKVVLRKGLSIFIWPEGTRSRTGRLQPFKKGLVHLALQTTLPLIPVIVQDACRCWEKKTLTIRGVNIKINIIPPIDTSNWSLERLEKALEEVHAQFLKFLPLYQQPETESAMAWHRCRRVFQIIEPIA